MIPDMYASHGKPELCAAFAPRYLALNEGGADEVTDIVRRAYAAVGAEDHLQICYYPKYEDPANRPAMGPIPKYGLTMDQFYEDYSFVDVPDHSFRAERSIELLRKAFGR